MKRIEFLACLDEFRPDHGGHALTKMAHAASLLLEDRNRSNFEQKKALERMSYCLLLAEDSRKMLMQLYAARDKVA